MNIEEQGSQRYNPFENTYSDDEISNFVNMVRSMHKCVQSQGIMEIRGTLFGNPSCNSFIVFLLY